MNNSKKTDFHAEHFLNQNIFFQILSKNFDRNEFLIFLLTFSQCPIFFTRSEAKKQQRNTRYPHTTSYTETEKVVARTYFKRSLGILLFSVLLKNSLSNSSDSIADRTFSSTPHMHTYPFIIILCVQNRNVHKTIKCLFAHDALTTFR